MFSGVWGYAKLLNWNCERFVVFYWISKDHTIRRFHFVNGTHVFFVIWTWFWNKSPWPTNCCTPALKIGTSLAMVLPSVLASELKNGNWLWVCLMTFSPTFKAGKWETGTCRTLGGATECRTWCCFLFKMMKSENPSWWIWLYPHIGFNQRVP